MSNRQNFDVIIFDLDGTLVDSRVDLANSVNYTRTRLGLPPVSNELVYTYVGDGAFLLLQRALGPEFGETEVREAVKIFLENYSQHLLDHTFLYPGVEEVLEQLKHLALTVLTNKPVGPSISILKGLGVLEKFKLVYGGDSFPQKKPHPAGIQKILIETGIPPHRALMVGDSRNDIMTGRNAGIPTCGVTYGLAPDQLKDPLPDYVIDDMRELPGLITR
ncbi:MAG TPA: HAD-IA family hydrolase [Terriglobia bacterium]|nr:HAD-IA family hydrolase [Terriglobia bacterium]